MQQQTLDLLKALADRLGIALSDLIKAFTKQCAVEGWYSLALSLALFLGFYFTSQLIKRHFERLAKDPVLRDDALLLKAWQAILYALSITLLLLPAILTLNNITKALAPEACAISSILETVKK